MTLEEFLDTIKGDIDNFEKHWRSENRSMPDLYPMEMGLGDWFEQFLFVSELEIPERSN